MLTQDLYIFEYKDHCLKAFELANELRIIYLAASVK